MDANASWLWAFDPTAGTGGMLLVAARALKELNPDIEVVLAGQELMSTGYAIGKADLVIQGGEPDAIRHGDTLLNDLYEGEQFEYILSNPPFGMDWEVQQQSVKQQAKVPGSRFSHGLPSKDDGQMLFLAHVASKLMPAGPNGSGGRGAVVSNGSPLFTGAPESGPDKIRAWLLENDLVDAIIQLPTNMFYGTGISTYVWILDTNKEEHRKGFVQLIDASECWSVPEKGLGEKRREMKEPDRKRVLEEYAAFEDTEISKVLTPADLGFRDVKVTKQKRLRVAVTLEAVARVLEHKYTVSEQANVADMRFNDLPEALKAAAKKRGVKILAGIIDVVLEAVGVSDEKSKGYDFRSLVAFADVERAFKDDEQDYRVIIVANKFQTGFNEPRLCAMYVDKQLCGVTTVQTLSRLNRIHENKPTPMVVDFVNDPEMIVKDFKRYYEGAAINTDIDPNALHTLGEELDTSGFYTPRGDGAGRADLHGRHRLGSAPRRGGANHPAMAGSTQLRQRWARRCPQLQVQRGKVPPRLRVPLPDRRLRRRGGFQARDARRRAGAQPPLLGVRRRGRGLHHGTLTGRCCDHPKRDRGRSVIDRRRSRGPVGTNLRRHRRRGCYPATRCIRRGSR